MGIVQSPRNLEKRILTEALGFIVRRSGRALDRTRNKQRAGTARDDRNAATLAA
jgi:hypothetical protein